NNVLSNHKKRTTKDLKEDLLKDFHNFRGNAARQDDITFIVFKYSPDITKTKTPEQEKKDAIEDKIRWALKNEKPIQIRTNRYLTEDRDFIDSILDRFLNEAGIKFLMNKLSYCLHELATNAKKANTKRAYFKSKDLDINNSEDYEIGMQDFKMATIGKIEHYLNLQKKMGLFIVIMFQLTKKDLRISVVNNSEMTKNEKEKVQHKLDIASQKDSIGEVYDQIEDYSEGAGLGIVMMSQMLRTMGFENDVLSITSNQGLTNATLLINLRE
ncbi:MAG: hypothetical protein PQJ46_13545, partial [Spirochaetales bacterium]|nr:hypothetical protein [Spirochaetales bacterium]